MQCLCVLSTDLAEMFRQERLSERFGAYAKGFVALRRAQGDGGFRGLLKDALRGIRAAPNCGVFSHYLRISRSYFVKSAFQSELGLARKVSSPFDELRMTVGFAVC